MFNKVFTIILIILIFLPLQIRASESGVVINSFRISGQSSTDEYIELYNSSDRDINLLGWRLSKKTASGNISNLLTSFPEVYLEPDSNLIIAHENCTCSPDLKYSTSGSIAEDNTVILFSDNGKSIVDKVGFGLAIDFEGSPAQNPNTGEIYGRKNNGLDTDNNKADFHLIYAPPKPKEEPKINPVSPDKAASNSTEKQSDAKLIVTEFLPNPEGADSEKEFIEIKNIGQVTDIGGYYIADTIGSPKSYKIPEGTILGAGQYLAFYSAKTPISLNNKGDGVEVWDRDKKVIDSSPDDCGKAPEGLSYALSDSGWVWTKTPTPGKANIINPPAPEEIDGQDSEGEVLSMTDTNVLPDQGNEEDDHKTRNDKIFGIVLLIVAIIGTISYTLYTNKEKLVELYNKTRDRNDSLGAKIRKKIKGR
jgi:hypothetical protein